MYNAQNSLDHYAKLYTSHKSNNTTTILHTHDALKMRIKHVTYRRKIKMHKTTAEYVYAGYANHNAKCTLYTVSQKGPPTFFAVTHAGVVGF